MNIHSCLLKTWPSVIVTSHGARAAGEKIGGGCLCRNNLRSSSSRSLGRYWKEERESEWQVSWLVSLATRNDFRLKPFNRRFFPLFFLQPEHPWHTEGQESRHQDPCSTSWTTGLLLPSRLLSIVPVCSDRPARRGFITVHLHTFGNFAVCSEFKCVVFWRGAFYAAWEDSRARFCFWNTVCIKRMLVLEMRLV